MTTKSEGRVCYCVDRIGSITKIEVRDFLRFYFFIEAPWGSDECKKALAKYKRFQVFDTLEDACKYAFNNTNMVDFINTFTAYMSSTYRNYDYHADVLSKRPWCKPWLYKDLKDFWPDGVTSGAKAAKAYIKDVSDELDKSYERLTIADRVCQGGFRFD